MQIHNLIQGSSEWHQFRLEHFGASEAAAMLGLSSKVSRTELLHMKHTGTAKEFSDWVQANILDYGHEVEALARPLAEDLIGAELYPVTCSAGPLSASCDGLTMAEDVAFEHKQWNEALAASVAADVLPEEYQPQCQQIMMVTKCEKVLFVVSDGTSERFVSMVVEPDPEWAARISAGWEQFRADLAIYEPKNFAPKPAAEPIMQLPALAIQIKGEVTVSNLPQFKAKADLFIASIKTDLLTDEDFANAEATIKFCDGAEKSLEQAKAAAIAQTADIDELMRTVDHIKAQLREKRLLLTGTVKDKKELLKASILNKAKTDFADHVAALEAEIAPLRLVYQARDFAGAMKNKRTLATLHDAVDTEMANGKITVDAIAKAVRGRLNWYREAIIEEGWPDYSFLFADLQAVIQKPDDDFKLAVNSRIDAHKATEAKKAADAIAVKAAAPELDRLAAFDAAASARPAGKSMLAPVAAWSLPNERARLKTAVEFAQLQLTSAVQALAAFDALAENNIYPNLAAAEALEDVLRDRAHEDCEGAGNCGASEYRQEFLVAGEKHVAIFTPEYNRHDKTYYYIDGSNFRIESCDVAQAA